MKLNIKFFLLAVMCVTETLQLCNRDTQVVRFQRIDKGGILFKERCEEREKHVEKDGFLTIYENCVYQPLEDAHKIKQLYKYKLWDCCCPKHIIDLNGDSHVHPPAVENNKHTLRHQYRHRKH